MTILAKQIEKGKTYKNTSNGWECQKTIEDIKITKSGRYKFLFTEKWISLENGLETINKTRWDNSSVKGDYPKFESEI